MKRTKAQMEAEIERLRIALTHEAFDCIEKIGKYRIAMSIIDMLLADALDAVEINAPHVAIARIKQAREIAKS